MTQRQDNHHNPFQGLVPFLREDAGRFFGRQDLVQEGLERLSANAQSRMPMLLLLGESGCGKRSLMSAGILPALLKSFEQRFGQEPLYASMNSCDVSLDPFKGFIHSLCQSQAALFEFDEQRDLFAILNRDLDGFLALLSERLAQKQNPAPMVLTIPDLEQLFFNSTLNPLQRRIFAELIARLVKELDVHVLVTFRSDQYHHLVELPALFAIKRHTQQLDVMPPTYEQLLYMIEQPLAGTDCQFEKQDGNSLAQVIAQRALEYPNSLPLLSTLMSRLYEGRTNEGLLRFAIYRQLGGLDSVLPMLAERVYDNLDRSVRKHYVRIFSHLVTLNDKTEFLPQWVNLSELTISDRGAECVHAFIDAGILQVQFDGDGNTMVSVAHPCLIQHWPRLTNALSDHRKNLLLKEELMQRAKQWETATRPSAYLLKDSKSLYEATRLLKRSGKVEPAIKALVKASMQRVKRNKLILIAGAAVVVFAFGFTLMQSYQSKTDAVLAQKRLDDSHQLIQFLIADEHQKLDEIGRLDVMQSGSEKSMAYLSQVSTADESTASKLSRSQTFHQIGEVYMATQQYAAALEAFNMALALNQELLEIHPNSFVHALALAKAHYWIAEAYRASGELDKADTGYQSYQKVAYDLVKMKPDDNYAKLELARAYHNVAQVASLLGQNERAMQNYIESTKFAEKGRVVANVEALSDLIAAYTWLSTRYTSEFKINEALEASKGRVFASQSMLAADNNAANLRLWLLAKWDYSEKLILVGKNKLALSVLQDLLEEINKQNFDTSDEQIQSLVAYVLARQGQIFQLTGKDSSAQEQMLDSAKRLSLDSQPADESWLDAHFERLYWLARVAHIYAPQEYQKYRAAVINSEHELARKWQIRLASLENQTLSLPPLDDQISTRNPYELLAYIEYAIVHQKTEHVEALRDLVPQEMWLHSELETLRSQIRQLL